MNLSHTPRRVALALGASALLVGSIAGPAFAADVVTQGVTPGNRTASVANLSFTAVAYSHSAQTPTSSMTLTADDSTGSGAGWNVTVVTSAFVYSGGNGGTSIPAVNFSLSSAAEPVMTAGQAVDLDTDTAGPDTANGPKVPATTPVGTLDSPRKVVQADAAFGQGTYTQALGVSLTIPAQSRAGTYTGTLTTTITAAP